MLSCSVPPSPPLVHTFPWHPSLPPLTCRASPCCPDPLLRPPGQSVYEPWPPSRWPYRDKCALYVKCWDGDNGLRPFFVPPRLPPSKPHRPTCVTASMRAGRRTSSSAISAIPPPPHHLHQSHLSTLPDCLYAGGQAGQQRQQSSSASKAAISASPLEPPCVKHSRRCGGSLKRRSVPPRCVN